MLSALIAGTFAPDIEYFLRLMPGGGWGHRFWGAFFLSLPLGLVFLWLFHRVVKAPAVALMPDAMQRRLAPRLEPFRFGPARRFLLIVLSVLVGIFTHILWDDFTHSRSFVFHHWYFLHHVVKLPVVGWVPYYEILQYISTVGGLVALVLWVAHWYRTATPVEKPDWRQFSPVEKVAALSSMSVVAALGALMRGMIAVGVPRSVGPTERFVGASVVTFMALVWWQLVVWGVLLNWRAERRAKASRQRTGRSQS